MIVIITGASRGIGFAIAEKFAAAGAHLLLCARGVEQLRNAAERLKRSYPQSVVDHFGADLSRREEVDSFAGWCLQKGTPTILVNNAGVYLPGNVHDEAEGLLESMIAVNLYSAYYLSRALLPSMKMLKQGHVFNICSIASLRPYTGGGGYSISKYALHGFSQNLREEMKPFGIKVTGVYPGAVMTESWGDFDNSQGRIMEAADVAAMVFSAASLSPQAVVEDIILRPQLGDL